MTQHQQADPLFIALLKPSINGPDDVYFLNTRVGPSLPPSQPTAQLMDAVQPATPQTPTAPALEPLPPMGMAALCLDNSTRSVINDIVCRAAEADSRTVYRIVPATLPSGRTRGDMPPA